MCCSMRIQPYVLLDMMALQLQMPSAWLLWRDFMPMHAVVLQLQWSQDTGGLS